MSHKGFSHIGLSTLDLDKTREFYEGVLGFKPVVCDTITVEEGGKIRHIFFDTGRDQLIAFMEPRDVPGVPREYDAGINLGLGLPGGIYHFAFEAWQRSRARAETRGTHRQRRRGQHRRRSRLGKVDLLQGSQPHIVGVLLSDARIQRERRANAGPLQHFAQSARGSGCDTFRPQRSNGQPAAIAR